MVFSNKKRILHCIIVVLLVVVCSYFVYKKFISSDGNSQTITQEEDKFKEAIAVSDKLENEQKSLLYDTTELKEMSDSYDRGDYQATVLVAEEYCPGLQGNKRYICYGVEAQALSKLKNYDSLKALAEKMLSEEAVTSDETLKFSWDSIMLGASQQKDPSEVQMISDYEARN